MVKLVKANKNKLNITRGCKSKRRGIELMCQEVLNYICQMDPDSIQFQLVLQCAPVITGKKISNLLTVSRQMTASLYRIFKGSNLKFYYLSSKNEKCTYLVFRERDMQRYLSEAKVQEFLSKNGYNIHSMAGILQRFHERYDAYLRGMEKSFPHEIGVMLGYPIEDVEGFIQNAGGSYLFAGYWKVYHNVEQKKRLFESYENAKEELIQMIAADHDIRSIIQKFNRSRFMQTAG